MKDETYRVLVVDDSAEQAEMLVEFLRLSGFFSVDVADSLGGLWKRLAAGKYAIVLLDYRLPDGTGLEALKEFPERGIEVPVVMVTAQGDERVAVQAMQHGAADYLMKSGDYLVTLPALIRKTVRAYQLQLSMQRSLDENRYQAMLLNNVRDAVVVWDLDGQITYWNPAAFLLFGWSPDERLGKAVAETYLNAFNPPIVPPRPGDTQGQHIVRQCRNRHQQVLWVSSLVTPLRDAGAGNRLIGYMDVSHDITKRKEAEEALRAERNFVSAVLDTVGALVVVLDAQGRIVRFNRACEQTLGYSFLEVRGKYGWEVLALPDDQAGLTGIFQTVQGGNFPNQHENYLRNRRGETRLIAWSNTALTGREGQVEYVIATGLDITERRQAERALQESEARYRAIVDDYQTELICRYTPEGTLTFVNEVYCRYFGKSREELLGCNFLDFLLPADRQQALRRLASFSPERPVGTIEHQVILPGEGIRWQQWTDRAIFDSQGALFEIQSVGRDTTERKRMEAQIQAAQAHLTEATRLATIGEMASGVAHQINNPLTTIIAEAQILQRQLAGDAPGRDSVDAIEQAGWRVQEAVQRLLEFSRPASTTLESVAISESINRALALVGAHIESSGVRVETHLTPGLPAVRGNLRQLDDLWVNLLLLARDACSDGAAHTILIRSYAGDGAPAGGSAAASGAVVVEVQDDGASIPPQLLDSVFEPDFIGPTLGRGTGMELSICRELVRQHGGSIQVQSNPGHVTIFRVTLPSVTLPSVTLPSVTLPNVPFSNAPLPGSPSALRSGDPPLDDQDGIEPQSGEV